MPSEVLSFPPGSGQKPNEQRGLAGEWQRVIEGAQRYFNIVTVLLVSTSCISSLNGDQVLKDFACQVEGSLVDLNTMGAIGIPLRFIHHDVFFRTWKY